MNCVADSGEEDKGDLVHLLKQRGVGVLWIVPDQRAQSGKNLSVMFWFIFNL